MLIYYFSTYWRLDFIVTRKYTSFILIQNHLPLNNQNQTVVSNKLLIQTFSIYTIRKTNHWIIPKFCKRNKQNKFHYTRCKMKKNINYVDVYVSHVSHKDIVVIQRKCNCCDVHHSSNIYSQNSTKYVKLLNELNKIIESYKSLA